jgi:hypothetical protein
MLETMLISSAIGGGLSALQNLISGDPADEQNERIDKILKKMEAMKLGQGETTMKLDRISDLYNTNMMNTLNDTAVGLTLSGVENPEVLRADMTSQMLGERSKATIEEMRRIEDYNTSIEMNQMQLELGRPVSQKPDMFTDFLGGAMQGAAMGFQIAGFQEMEKMNEGLLGYLGKDGDGPTAFAGALPSLVNPTKTVNQIFSGGISSLGKGVDEIVKAANPNLFELPKLDFGKPQGMQLKFDSPWL